MSYDEDKLRFELTRDEGKRLKPYRDSMGNWTVGIGHLIQPGEPIAPISEAQCFNLFLLDVADAERKLNGILPGWRNFSDVRQRALLNLTFNLGYKLKKFHRFIAAMQCENYHSAGEHLRDSLWFKQVGLRAPRIIHMIQNDSDWGGK